MNYFHKPYPYPYLLIDRGKHGDMYYHIDCEESSTNALFRIFENRKNMGYYYFPDYTEKTLYIKETIQSLTTIDQSNLPPDVVGYINEQKITLKRQLQYLKDEIVDHSLYCKILKKDEKALYMFLENRLGHEYEKILIEKYS